MLFRLLAEHYRFQGGLDELSPQDVVERFNRRAARECYAPPREAMTLANAERAIALLAERGCIEIASKSADRTVWRYVPGSKCPDEEAVQTFAQYR